LTILSTSGSLAVSLSLARISPMRQLAGLGHAEEFQAVKRLGVLEVGLHESVDLALVSRAFFAIAVLRPSRELAVASQRSSTVAASSPIRRNSSSSSVSFSWRARVATFLVAAWAACASPRDFRQLLVEVG